MSVIDLTEVAGAKATHRYARLSASKVRVVLNLIRNEDVDRASDILRFSDRGAADVVAKVLNSAIANATNNEGLDEDELYVAECFANEGPTLKRWRPRARGRASRINKRTCHITVVVARLDDTELEIREGRAAQSSGGADRSARVAASRRVAGAGDEATDEVEDDVVDEAAEAQATEPAEPDTDVVDEPFGPGSITAPADDSAPEGYDIKGNADSMKYHEPDGRWYDNTVAAVWFDSVEAAVAAGFVKAGTRTKVVNDDSTDDQDAPIEGED